MRWFSIIILGSIIFSSCNGRKARFLDTKKNDTIQFTYIYSEALKNKMLGQEINAYNQFKRCLSMKPKSSASAYQLSLLSFEKRDYLSAKKYADFCLSIVPDNEWYLIARANVARELNEKEIYESIYTKLANLFPNNLSYAFELAIIQFNNKNYYEALAILDSLEEEIGINENISFLKNNINFALERYDAIQLELLNLQKAYPDSVKYSDMLAEFFLNFNFPEKALLMYQKVLDTDSSNIFAKAGISWIYGKLGKYQDGYPYLLSCIKSDQIMFDRKLKISNLYFDAKNNRLSELYISKIFETLVNDKNITGDFLAKYIGYLYQRKDLSEAEIYALKAINQFPDNYTCWDYYYNILIIQNRPEALNTFSLKGLEYFPNHATVYFYTGYSYFLLRDYGNAVNYLEMGLDYVVEDQSLNKQFYLTLAESYHSLGKHQQSDSFFDKYLEKDSTNAYLMNNYAYYLIQRNIDHNKSLGLSRKSIELDPFNSSFLDTYSWILYKMEDFQQALNYISRAYKYGGNKNPVILEHYGDILFKLGNTQEAVLRWKDAYKLNNSINLLKKINSVSNN